MVSLFNYDDDLIQSCIREFVAAKFPNQTFSHTCIYRSLDFPDERQVFLVGIGDHRFALKLDTTSPETLRLEKEFQVLQKLRDHFSGHDRLAVVKPVYLSPEGHFFVTDFVGDKTATDAIYHTGPDNRAAQVYRRAGEWLHVLHEFKQIAQERFWYDWMFESIDEILTKTPPQASKTLFGPMIAQMERDAVKFDGINDCKTFSHGDFHGRNLILGTGGVYGLDFTEVSEKLAVYDIADFLKADVFRDGNAEDVDRSGILKNNKDMFLKLYRHPINVDVLDFCVRARLLIDWLGISKERYNGSLFQSKKFDRLRDRLSIAFQSAL